MSFPGEDPGRHLNEMLRVKPATDQEIAEIERRIARGDENPWSVIMVEALIARIEHDQAKLDAKDWALGKIVNTLHSQYQGLHLYEQEIIQTAQAALAAQPREY